MLPIYSPNLAQAELVFGILRNTLIAKTKSIRFTLIRAHEIR